MQGEEIKTQVRDYYGRRASGEGCCGSAALDACCTSSPSESVDEFTGPSLGCGSPLAYAAPKPGETVVDLGSGAGREVLLAARQVGASGRAIGIDMTPEMIAKARENAVRAGIANAEFHLGEIEAMPLSDATADVVISNCVINLIPEKAAAFREAFRVLRPGGRLIVSDIVTNGPLPAVIRNFAGAWAACVAGAADLTTYLSSIESAGFVDVQTLTSAPAPPGMVFSATVSARKPA